MTHSKGSFKMPPEPQYCPSLCHSNLISSSIITRAGRKHRRSEMNSVNTHSNCKSSTQRPGRIGRHQPRPLLGVYMIVFVKPTYTMSFKNICICDSLVGKLLCTCFRAAMEPNTRKKSPEKSRAIIFIITRHQKQLVTPGINSIKVKITQKLNN